MNIISVHKMTNKPNEDTNKSQVLGNYALFFIIKENYRLPITSETVKYCFYRAKINRANDNNSYKELHAANCAYFEQFLQYLRTI